MHNGVKSPVAVVSDEQGGTSSNIPPIYFKKHLQKGGRSAYGYRNFKKLKIQYDKNCSQNQIIIFINLNRFRL